VPWFKGSESEANTEEPTKRVGVGGKGKCSQMGRSGGEGGNVITVGDSINADVIYKHSDGSKKRQIGREAERLLKDKQRGG